jgi:hypothetical protein
MTIITFLFPGADFPPDMQTSLMAFQITAKPATIPEPFEDAAALLAADTVIIADTLVVFAGHHIHTG